LRRAQRPDMLRIALKCLVNTSFARALPGETGQAAPANTHPHGHARRKWQAGSRFSDARCKRRMTRDPHGQTRSNPTRTSRREGLGVRCEAFSEFLTCKWFVSRGRLRDLSVCEHGNAAMLKTMLEEEKKEKRVWLEISRAFYTPKTPHHSCPTCGVNKHRPGRTH